MQLVGSWWVVTMVSNSSSVELFGGLTKTCSCHFIVHDDFEWFLMAKTAEGKCSIVSTGWFLKVSGELGTKQMTSFGWSINSFFGGFLLGFIGIPLHNRHNLRNISVARGHWKTGAILREMGAMERWELWPQMAGEPGWTRVQRRVGVRTRPGLGGENCI